MFQRPLKEPGVQGIHIERRGPTKSQVGLHIASLDTLGPPVGVQGKDAWVQSQLLSDEGNDHVGRRLKVCRHKPEIPQCAQLERIPQTVRGLALAVHFACIVLREQKVHRKIVLENGVGKVLPAFPLGLGEKTDGHRALLSANGPILLANPQVPKFVCPTCLL